MSDAAGVTTKKSFNQGTWTIKSKWYHIVFWASYFVFWVMVSSSLPLIDNVLINILFLVCSIVPVYTVLYYIMPKYLYTQNYLAFIFITVGLIILFASILGLTLNILYVIRNIPRDEFLEYPYILGPTLGSVATAVIFFMIGKLSKNYTQSEKKNIALEHEKTENELKFLKSQLNPHFLFNALNNIYFLIKKDPDTAAKSLAKFSDMFRYQLYECNEDEILLKQEVDYIKSYIQVASLSKAGITKITSQFEIGNAPLRITPMILVPLIENAFKHVSQNKEGQNYIHFSINLLGSSLVCETKNSIDYLELTKNTTNNKSGGLGLINLKRRLSIIYPDKYTLEINELKDLYHISLKLQL